MTHYKSLIAVMLLVCTSAHAYLARVENATSGAIAVTINLAACAPIQIGLLKPGEVSRIFDTGACCFDSISATGTTDPIMNMNSGNVRPWGTGWQCFQNLHFKCYEMKSGGRAIGIGFQHANLAG